MLTRRTRTVRPVRVNTAVSLVYCTHRRDPAFEWFADGLVRQLGDDHVEVVVVDGSGLDRRDAFVDAAAGRFDLRWTPSKPTVFNGPHHTTSRDLHAASSARNTGLVVASQPYVVFVDDCSVPMPGWWAEVREASRHHYVVGGAYQKHHEMVVVDGELRSSRSTGLDIRWDSGRDDRVTAMPASHLFGSSLGVPRAAMIEIGGFDEMCDGCGGEDYQLGLRLEHAGHPLFYSRSMLTVESEEHHSGVGQVVQRVDVEVDEPTYMAKLVEFGVEHRSTAGRFDASHMVLDLVLGSRATVSLGNHCRMADLTEDDLPGTADTLPRTYWFDGRPFADL